MRSEAQVTQDGAAMDRGPEGLPATLDDAVAFLALHVQDLTLGDVAAALHRGTLVADVPVRNGSLTLRATITTLPVQRIGRLSSNQDTSCGSNPGR